MRLLITLKLVMLPAAGLLFPLLLCAQKWTEIQGKVTDERMKPLAFATVTLTDGAWNTSVTTKTDGSFTIGWIPGSAAFSATIQVSHVGKASLARVMNAGNMGNQQLFILPDLNLKLPEVEVSGIRKRTMGSNSSIVFDREAIEQTQALSIANVLSYLPGQTILKPVVSVQGLQALTLRAAVSQNSIDALNNAFGINFQVDGSSISNDANMQAMNPGRSGFFGANNIQNPENGVIRDRSYRNGTLYSSYSNISQANNGIDMRQIPAENIESIEVISGVASARYGDYTTGVINIQRQAGITPWRINARVNEATQDIGINKGFQLKKGAGALNLGFDYLNSNDDPTNSLKGYQRISGSLLWTYQQNDHHRFRNTLGVDINATLDQTKLDPDLGTDRMARFKNHRVNISNRSSWVFKKPWIHDLQLQASYSFGRQESYDQYYINSTTVRGITDAMTTGIFEGHYIPGYYLAFRQIIGEPVSASARIEGTSIFRIKKDITYKLSVGANYSYNANKGPGLVLDPDRPRLSSIIERPRPYTQTPALSNAGVYAENNFTAHIAGRPFSANLGLRGDIQNSFFTVSPRLSANYSITKKLGWNMAYGIATKAPALSQISPGDTYVDVPLINVYNGNVNESVYLAYTRVISGNKNDIRPYRSNTFETGLTYDMRPLHISAYYFNRINANGFTTQQVLQPVALPDYNVASTPGQKPTYSPSGSTTIYNLTYNLISNGQYSRTNGVELMVSTDKIQSIQTSFNVSTAWYATYSKNSNSLVNLEGVIRYDLPAVYGVFSNTESSLVNIKSTVGANTHIPQLRMVVTTTAELFWVNNNRSYPSSIYPVGYYDKNVQYYPLTPEQARSAEYAHLVKLGSPNGGAVSMTPPFVYSNISMRLSKEIGDYLRFSFSAYNVFNIRPSYATAGGTTYFNGQPAYGAEIIFTIK